MSPVKLTMHPIVSFNLDTIGFFLFFKIILKSSFVKFKVKVASDKFWLELCKINVDTKLRNVIFKLFSAKCP